MLFKLDPQLEKDSSWICDLSLSQVRLSNNAAFPWIILIPKKAGMSEIIDLTSNEQTQLWQEISQSSLVMRELFSPTKLNVANLGNVVAQLHIHVIARFKTDKAWPGPVWNSQVSAEYDAQNQQKIISQLANAFQA